MALPRGLREHVSGPVVLRRRRASGVVFPHADLHTYKKRPALVVQTDRFQTGIPQRIVAMITSNLARTGPSRVMARKHSPGGRAMGLLHDSVVVADNLHGSVTESPLSGDPVADLPQVLDAL